MIPLYTSKPELERSGMGFTVMQTFMDELKVESYKDKGTKVIMFKVFNIKSSDQGSIKDNIRMTILN